MSKAQQKVYSEMQNELAARKRMLEAERTLLVKASARIEEIDAEIAVINTETEEYAIAKGSLIPEREDKAK